MFNECLDYVYVVPDIYTFLHADIIPALKNLKTYFSNLEKCFDTVNSNLLTINDNLNVFSTNFNTFSALFESYQNDVKIYLQTAVSYLGSMKKSLTGIEKWYYPQPYEAGIEYDEFNTLVGWRSFWSTFRYKKFDEVLLEVNQQIEDKVNPLSENNSVAFEGAITNIKDNTFIGSANEMVTTFPEELKGALNKDSSPVLQFTTAGVSNSYFSLPAKKYSIDFSFYAPFKGTADTVISAFMYLGFLIAFWKRLPEIIHGAGVMYVGQAEFHESQFNDRVSDTMANDYYEQLVSHDGYDDLDMADGEYDSYGNYSSYERDWW